MKLAVNILSGGRYFRAGDDVDEKLIPSKLRKVNNDYAAKLQRQREEADADQGISMRSAHAPTRGKPKPGQRYVRRKFGFLRVDGLALAPGEKLYQRQGNAFVRVGRVPKAQNAL